MEYSSKVHQEVNPPPGLRNLGRSARKAITWIAYNDNEGGGDRAEEISSYISVCLVADVWNLNRARLGEYIRALRTTQGLP